MNEFRLRFHWSLKGPISRIGSDNGLASVGQQAIVWTDDG